MYLFLLLHFYCREGGCFLKKLLVYIRDFRLECVLAPLFKLLEASFELIVPLIMAAIIDRGIPSGDTGFIVRMCLWLVVLGGVGLLSSVTAQYFSAKAAIGFSAKLRHVLMAHIQTLSYTELDTVGTSTLITRMNSDINQVQTGVNMCLRLLLRSPFVVFGAMVMAFTIDTKCALIFAGVIAVLCVIVFSIMLATIPMYRRVQGQLDSVTATTRENLTGVRVVRAFCKEDAERAKFERKLQLLTRMQLAVGRISAMMNPATYVVINAAVIVLIHTGAVRVQMGALSQGQVVALYNYMSQILVELIKMANLIITLTKAAACGDRVAAVLAIRSTQKDGEKTPAIDAPRGSVVFDSVSMCYSGAGAESVSSVSFTAAPGATIGVIGGTGSGKSTLINLIPRFYDCTSGSVELFGHAVQQYGFAQLRQMIGIVPQRAVLFTGTIRDNMQWACPDATDEQIWQALEIAQAADFVRGKPKGLDEPVETAGRNFSGGQRQRLTIARALVPHPQVLILDDSSSALDFATDAALRKALKEQTHGMTVFIVSQRASAVQRADRILVLDDGNLVGSGTHTNLLKTCDVYREICLSQLSREEVEKTL